MRTYMCECSAWVYISWMYTMLHHKHDKSTHIESASQNHPTTVWATIFHMPLYNTHWMAHTRLLHVHMRLSVVLNVYRDAEASRMQHSIQLDFGSPTHTEIALARFGHYFSGWQHRRISLIVSAIAEVSRCRRRYHTHKHTGPECSSVSLADCWLFSRK